MKNHIFIVIFLFFSILNTSSQEWERTNLPTTIVSPYFGAMNGGIVFINADTGWLFNAKHDFNSDPVQIYKTTNKGTNWFLLAEIPVEGNNPSDRLHTYNALSFINANTGWLSFAVDAFDDKAFIYKTTNGGTSWSKIYEETGYLQNTMWGALTFVDANIGFLRRGNKLYRTLNGGPNWTNIYTASAPFYANDVRIYNNIIYIAGTSVVNLPPVMYYPYLIKSTDYGNSFTTILGGTSGSTGGINSINVTKDNNNQDIIKCACENGIYNLNSNNTFTFLNDPLPNAQTYGFLEYCNSNYGTVAGYSSTSKNLIYTSNQGYSWTDVPNYTGGEVVFPR